MGLKPARAAVAGGGPPAVADADNAPAAGQPAGPAAGRSWLGWAALLAVLTGVAYARVLQAGFVNFDDSPLLVENPHVNQGFSRAGFGWALTTGFHGNWVPLTWLSHQACFQLFGAAPGGAPFGQPAVAPV